MNARTAAINEAIRIAKRRDNYQCRICGQGRAQSMVVDGAHLLPRNVAFREYNAADPEWIVTLCRRHHLEFDRNHTPMLKANYMQRQGQDELSLKICMTAGIKLQN